MDVCAREEETKKWIRFTDLFKLQFWGWGYENEDVAVSLRRTSPSITARSSDKSGQRCNQPPPSPLEYNYKMLSLSNSAYAEHRMLQNAEPNPTWKWVELHQVASSSFLYCLHGSKLVALKTEMKSSPCFLEASSVLLLWSGPGQSPNISARLPLWRGKSEATPLSHTKVLIYCKLHGSAFFFSPICYHYDPCLLTHLLPPSKALRKESPWEATSKVCSNNRYHSLSTYYVWDTVLSILFYLIFTTL